MTVYTLETNKSVITLAGEVTGQGGGLNFPLTIPCTPAGSRPFCSLVPRVSLLLAPKSEREREREREREGERETGRVSPKIWEITNERKRTKF